MEAKPFSIGFRIEHPQGLIDRARWGRHAGHPLLGAADYKLVHHASNGRSVYSFCMCPGGTVVAATSEPGRVVTNGMSQYSRNERNANAGIVVGIDPADYPLATGAAGGLRRWPASRCSASWESRAFVLGGGNYERARRSWSATSSPAAPRRSSAASSPRTSPGVTTWATCAAALPGYAIDAMREALPAFGRKIKGFDMPDARADRRRDAHLVAAADHPRRRLPEPQRRGLYPAGEGASYAGGILSAGVDGIKVAEAVGRALLPTQN